MGGKGCQSCFCIFIEAFEEGDTYCILYSDINGTVPDECVFFVEMGITIIILYVIVRTEIMA